MVKRITAPLTGEVARALRAGDACLLSGVIYAARDAAHARLCALLREGKPLPFDVRGSVLYYVGPTPAPEGRAIGSAGPTTSYRMDAYSPALVAAGSLGMIGKGTRGEEVVCALREHGAVYFAATGGLGALYSHCITASETVAYPELGPEAILRLTVRDMPLTVAIDSRGESIYELGPRRYLEFVNKT